MMERWKQTKLYQQRIFYAWSAAAILTCLFPPACVLVLLCAAQEKKWHVFGETYLRSAGKWTLFWGTFELILIPLATRSFDAIMLAFLPVLLSGLLMLKLHRDDQERDEEIRLCRSIVLDGHLTRIDHIAECLRKTPKQTAAFLRGVIREGLLEGCYVNQEETELVSTQPWAKLLFVCRNCGASTVGNLGVQLTCPYCGSPFDNQNADG